MTAKYSKFKAKNFNVIENIKVVSSIYFENRTPESVFGYYKYY